MRNLVFLLSFPRSGSTLLQSILATHPLIATRPEDCTLSGLLKVGGRLDQWQQRNIPAKYRSDGFDGYWLEKDVFLHNQLSKLQLAFPEAKFIWLLRSPEDCISSYWILHSESASSPYPIRYFANQWKAFEAAREQMGGLAISYENLVANPEAEISKIEEYLEIEHLCSTNPLDFNQQIALRAKIKHPSVLGGIALPQSKVGLLDENTLSEMVDTLYAANS